MNPFIAKDDGKYVLFSITFAVVPYVGTWIEICDTASHSDAVSRRSLRGNVDRNNCLFIDASKQTIGRSLRGNVDRNNPLDGKGCKNSKSFPTWERG